jgi:hypothetical protein
MLNFEQVQQIRGITLTGQALKDAIKKDMDAGIPPKELTDKYMMCSDSLYQKAGRKK